MRPSIDVIIAAYNAESTLAQTLDSILSQGVEVRIRIVDDGSTDATATVVRRHQSRHPGRIRYSRQANAGQQGPPPRNAGLRHATAPYVLFFDADDLLAPGYLAHALEVLDTHPQWGALIGDYRNFNETDTWASTHFATCPRLKSYLDQQTRGLTAREETGVQTLELDSRTTKLILTEENFSITGSVVYRTSVLQALGGFNPTLPRGEDFELFWRTLSAATVGLTTATAFHRRLHAQNLSSQAEAMLRGKLQGRQGLLEIEADRDVRIALHQCLARVLDQLSAECMPRQRLSACRTAMEAVREGWRYRIWPEQSARAFVRSLVSPATVRTVRRWREIAFTDPSAAARL